SLGRITIDEIRLRRRLDEMSDDEHATIEFYLATLHAKAIEAIERQTGMSFDAHLDKLIAENPAIAPRMRLLRASILAVLPPLPDVPCLSIRLKARPDALKGIGAAPPTEPRVRADRARAELLAWRDAAERRREEALGRIGRPEFDQGEAIVDELIADA